MIGGADAGLEVELAVAHAGAERGRGCCGGPGRGAPRGSAPAPGRCPRPAPGCAPAGCARARRCSSGVVSRSLTIAVAEELDRRCRAPRRGRRVGQRGESRIVGRDAHPSAMSRASRRPARAAARRRRGAGAVAADGRNAAPDTSPGVVDRWRARCRPESPSRGTDSSELEARAAPRRAARGSGRSSSRRRNSSRTRRRAAPRDARAAGRSRSASKRQRVLPDVALLPVAVLRDDVVVWMDREAAGVVAEDALEGEGDAAVAAGVGGEVDCRRRAGPCARRAPASMRSSVWPNIDDGLFMYASGNDQRDARRIDGRAPLVVKRRTAAAAGARGRSRSWLIEPQVAGAQRALRRLVVASASRRDRRSAPGSRAARRADRCGRRARGRTQSQSAVLSTPAGPAALEMQQRATIGGRRRGGARRPARSARRGRRSHRPALEGAAPAAPRWAGPARSRPRGSAALHAGIGPRRRSRPRARRRSAASGRCADRGLEPQGRRPRSARVDYDTYCDSCASVAIRPLSELSISPAVT